MKRVLKLVVALAAIVVFTRATCGRARPGQVTPVQRVTITDHVPYHNMGITFDGEHYFTINGGNEDYSVVKEYDRSGTLVTSYSFGIDGRSIGYNAEEEAFYVKPYAADLLVLDFDDESSETEHEGLFAQEQTSVAFSPDGAWAYELDGEEVRVYDLAEGEELNSIDIEGAYDEEQGGYNCSMAASDKFLFVWKSGTEVRVYDLSGEYVTSFELPRSGLGFSLSYCNGMLWVARDADGKADGADGKWFGYELRGLE
jgi:hypothetical protein